MRFVDHATLPPHRCAVIPFVGNATAQAGFIDTGMDLSVRGSAGERVYISVAEAGTQIAQAIGWSPPSAVRALQAENTEQRARIEALEAELAETTRALDAIEYIGRGPMKPYKKPGRPKKETADAAQ